MKRGIIALMVYIALFGTVLLLAIYSYSQSIELINIGMPAKTSDVLIGVLSFIGLLKSIWHVVRY